MTSKEQLADVIERLDFLVPAKETHRAITVEMGWEIVDILQDHKEAIFSALRSGSGSDR